MKTILLTALLTTVWVAAMTVSNNLPSKQEKPQRLGVFVSDSLGKQTALSIQTMRVNAEVVGSVARTTIDMVVYNPLNVIQEGEFSFPLSDGQSVARFALDIHGMLRDASVVSKSKGRETFEAITRRRVDPALLEWTRDNSFRTRIYPIPAKGTRRILIAVEQPLSSGDDGIKYRLPMYSPDLIDTFELTATVEGLTTVPSLTGGSGDTIPFSAFGRTFTANLKRTAVQLTEPFSIDIPLQHNLRFSAIGSRNSADTSAPYAAVFAMVPAESGQRPLPNDVMIVWDASLSATTRDSSREHAFVDALARALPTTTFHVIAVADTIVDQFALTPSSASKGGLYKRLRAIPRDGASALGVIPFDRPRGDITVYIGDGISTIGTHIPKRSPVPVYAVTASSRSDHDVLSGIAESSGGKKIDLMSASVDEAIASITMERRTITSIRTIDGAFEDIRPKGNIVVNGLVTIAGILRSASATIVLESSLGGRNVRSDTISIDAQSYRDSSGMIARLWALRELQELSQQRERNADNIKMLGLQFSLVTSQTSLIVLETLQDYVRYDIQPPDTEPALQAAWKQRIEHERMQKALALQNHRSMLTNYLNSFRLEMHVANVHGAIANAPKQPKTHSGQGTARKENSRDRSDTASQRPDTFEFLERSTASGKEIATSDVLVANPSTVPLTSSNTIIRPDVQSQLTHDALAAPTVHGGDLPLNIVPTLNGAALNETTTLVGRQAGKQVSSDGKLIRASRTTQSQPLVDGLEVTDQYTGGLGNSNNRVQQPPVLSAPSGFEASALLSNTPEIYPDPGTSDDEERDDSVRHILREPRRLRTVRRSPTDSARARGQTTPRQALASSSRYGITSYADYLTRRVLFMNDPAFYIEAADTLMSRGQSLLAYRVLGNLAELHGENAALLRILAGRLMQWNRQHDACLLYTDILRIRDEEPQSYRDLAQACIATGNVAQADTLYRYILSRPWDNRFPDIHAIAATELSALHRKGASLPPLDSLYMVDCQADVRVVLRWDTDNSDMDLHIVQPDAIELFYRNRSSNTGGIVSRDATGGYGPEVFTAANALRGTYTIRVHYYGDRNQGKAVPTTCFVDVYRNYGRANETKTTTMHRLSPTNKWLDVGTITVQ
jgi:tetratricopeptide (TPR) repeat protein